MSRIIINYTDRRLVVQDDHGCTYQDSFENFTEDVQREVPEVDACVVLYDTADKRLIAHTKCGSQTELQSSKLMDFVSWCLSTTSELKEFCENRAPSISQQTTPKSITMRVASIESQFEALQNMVLMQSKLINELMQELAAVKESRDDRAPGSDDEAGKERAFERARDGGTVPLLRSGGDDISSGEQSEA